MGGKVALEHQLKNKNAVALVLLSPATDADEKFSKITVPVLIIHSKDDRLPVQNSEKFALIEIESGGHSHKCIEEEVATAVAE